MVEVPYQLEGGLARAIKEGANGRIVFPIALFLFTLFGFIAVRTHSVYVYFIPPIVGPLLGSLILIAQPYNPYRNLYARFEGRDVANAAKDPTAQRLLSLLASKEAQAVAARTGISLTLLLCASMLIVAFIQRKTFELPTDVLGVPQYVLFNTFGLLGCFWVSASAFPTPMGFSEVPEGSDLKPTPRKRHSRSLAVYATTSTWEPLPRWDFSKPAMTSAPPAHPSFRARRLLEG